jgi:hypothetical protein
MKRAFTYLFVIVAALNFGCETRLFKYTVEINQSGTYTIDETGSFTKSSVFSRGSVARAFNLPEGARVLELKIESMSMRISVGGTNQATAVTVSGVMSRAVGSSGVLFSQFPVPLVAVNAPYIGINSLIDDGIGKLQTELENFVKGLGQNSLVEIAISGVSTPSGRKITFTIHLDIKATVKYERCEEILPGMSNAQSCEGGTGFTP